MVRGLNVVCQEHGALIPVGIMVPWTVELDELAFVLVAVSQACHDRQ